ncbi:MAG: hypothetical protein IJ551_00585 [Prevotella sp.]|nr:hypothetical protein [Prevotella sp.]
MKLKKRYWVIGFVGVVAVSAALLWHEHDGRSAETLRKEADSLYALSHRQLAVDNYSETFRNVTLAAALYKNLHDSVKLACTSVRLAAIYYALEQPSEAQEQLRIAEPLVDRLPLAVQASFYRISAICQTEVAHDYDRAVSLISKSIDIGRRGENLPSVYADMGNLAEVYINGRQFAKAAECLSQISDQAPAAAEPMLAQKYYCQGRIGFETHQPDSAYTALHRSVAYARKHHLLSIETDAMRLITSIDSLRGHQDLYIRHYRTYVALRDSLRGNQTTYRIAQMQEQNKITQIEQVHQRHRYRQNLTVLIMALVLMIAVFATVVLFLLYRRDKQKREIAELKSHQLEYEMGLEKLKSEKFEAEMNMERLRAEKLAYEKNLEQLQKELLELRIRNGESQLSQANKENLTMSLQLATLEQDNQKHLANFDRAFKQINEPFCQAITSLHPSITSTEQRLACLIRLHINAKEIAQTLNISPDSLYKLRYRLRKKLQLSGDQNLEAYICSIAVGRPETPADKDF